MRKRIFTLLLMIALIITGCSTGSINPVISTDQYPIPDLPVGKIDNIETNRTLLDMWTLDFNAEKLSVTATPDRNTAAHYNLTSVFPPSIQVISYDPLTGIVDVDVTFENPYSLDGYDLRLIVFTNDNGIQLINEDNWTPLYDIPGGSSINPFKAYAKLETNRQFAAYSQHTERCQFYLPAGGGNVTIAIDVSWPENCNEPYSIDNFTQSVLYDTLGSEAVFEVDVYDWQNDVDKVALYCPVLTGVFLDYFTYITSNKWRLNLVKQTDAFPGDYFGIIIAESANSGSLALYHLITITVSEDPVTDWTFMVYLHESNLIAGAAQDMREMEAVGSEDGVLNIIVLYDRTDNSQQDDAIYKVNQGESEVIDDQGEVITPGQDIDSGDQQTLENFLTWVMDDENFKARHYGLVLWNHGNGPFTEKVKKDCCDGLQVWEVRDACQNVFINQLDVDKLDFIGFDACLMSWIETAFCLRHVTKACIASEISIPETGWEYTTPLAQLKNDIKNYDYTLDGICDSFVRSYIDYYSDGFSQVTMAAWRSSEQVMVTFLNFSNELYNAIINTEHPEYRGEIENIWDSSVSGLWYYDPINPPYPDCSVEYVKDLGYFAELISSSSLPVELTNAASSLQSSIDSVMIHHDHTTNNCDCPCKETGWQIFFPNDYRDIGWDEEREDYARSSRRLKFSQTGWDDFLNEFDVITP